MCHFLNCHIGDCFCVERCYIKVKLFLFPMPLPEIHYSHAFGMGFWIDEDGILMSCPAVGSGMDVDNAIAVAEWDDFSVYSHNHLAVLAQIVQICTLKRDYVNIGYYAERFRTVA